jgi:predicted nucleic acid-binding protein
MIAYPDASFLFGLYVLQENTAAANAYAASMKEPIHVAALLSFEFTNALRHAAFRKALSVSTVVTALAAFESDVDNGVILIPSVSWETVHREAERLSNAHTVRDGHTSFDILHVATALTLKAREFLSFDAKQRALAAVEGLKVKP